MEDKDDGRSALPGWICTLDADEQTAKYIDDFDPQHVEVVRFLAAQAESVYDCQGIYVNFRKNRSVIKINRIIGEPNLAAAESLQQSAESFGFERRYNSKSNSIRYYATHDSFTTE